MTNDDDGLGGGGGGGGRAPMTIDDARGWGGLESQKVNDVICERSLTTTELNVQRVH